MKPIAAATNSAKFQAHAIDLNEGLRIAFSIKRAEHIVVGIQIASIAIEQVALGWFFVAE
jgi:hypothetical protein